MEPTYRPEMNILRTIAFYAVILYCIQNSFFNNRTLRGNFL